MDEYREELNIEGQEKKIRYGGKEKEGKEREGRTSPCASSQPTTYSTAFPTLIRNTKREYREQGK